jgi:hypothetical protein
MNARRNIGGVLDLAAYAAMANKHRPDDADALAAECRRLHQAGHSALFIAEALRLDPLVVADALTAAPVTGDRDG